MFPILWIGSISGHGFWGSDTVGFLVNWRLLNYWSRCFLDGAILLGKYLIVKLAVIYDQDTMFLFMIVRSSVEGVGSK